MATNNSNNTDSLPTADAASEMESEKSDYPACGPQNDCNNNGTNSGDAESVDQSVQSDAKTSQCRSAKRNAHCTGTRVLIATFLAALVMFAAITAGLGVYVSQLHAELRHATDRMDRFETQCNSGCTTLSMNKTQPISEVEDGDLLAQVFNLSMEIGRVRDSVSSLKHMIQTTQTAHENNIRQIQTNVSTMLTQINTSLTSSLTFFTNEVTSNLSELKSELSSVRNHSLVLDQTLTDQVSLLERRSDELETNVAALESSINEQLSRLTGNVSRNEERLSDVSTTQVGHITTIEKIKRNISLIGDRFDQRLTDVREHFTITLSDFNSSLSEIDANHRTYLGNLSSDLNDLSDELMATKEVFLTNTSALREELTELSVDLDYSNKNLTDLSSIQKLLLLDLADIKEIHSGNISSIGQSLVHLNEELGKTNEHLGNLSSIQDGLQRDLDLTNETLQSSISTLEVHSGNISSIRQSLIHLNEELGRTNEHLENLSSIQDGVQHDVYLTNEALQSNISALEQRFNREINHTEVQLQNQHTELLLNLGATRDRLEANISAFQESHGLLQGDLGIMKAKLQNVSSLYSNLQGDYDITKQELYTTRAATQQNLTQLYALFHNHSSVLEGHSRLLGDAAQSRSMLSGRIDETSVMVRSHDRLISVIRSNVTVVQNSMTGLRGTLTTNVNSLNTRIDDHVDWIQHTLAGQTQSLNDFESRITQVEIKLASDAVRVVPLGLLLTSVIALLVCYVIL